MRRFLENGISVIYSVFKLFLIKIFHFGKFRYHPIQRLSPSVTVRIGKGSFLTLGRIIRAHSGSKILVCAGGKLKIGANTRINYNCLIACRHEITIEKGVEFGPGVLVYDHDHDFRADGGLGAREYKCAPVTIGENSWIGANTIILRGTNIGKNCVIGAGCVVKGDVPDNTVLVQKRENEFIGI